MAQDVFRRALVPGWEILFCCKGNLKMADSAGLAEGESKENRIRILHARKRSIYCSSVGGMKDNCTVHQPQVRTNITRYEGACDNEVEGECTGVVPATWGSKGEE